MEMQQLLRKHFSSLSEKGLQEAIIEHGMVMQFEEGKVIMDFGEYINLVPLVVSGSIKVIRENEEGKEILLYYLTPGQTCSISFSCCMAHKQSIIRTTTEEPTTIIGIPIKFIDLWISQYQSWKQFIMQSYDNRMLDLLQVIDSIAFKQMDVRLWEYLQKKHQATQNPILQITHSEIANELNASREAISRLLKQLEKRSMVRLGRNQITLLTQSS